MEDFGYDFNFINDCKHNERTRSTRKFLRRVRMFYECDNLNCPFSKKDGKRFNKWPTYYGLIFITFKLVHVDKEKSVEKKAKDMKYPYLLRYNIRLYKQRCEKC